MAALSLLLTPLAHAQAEPGQRPVPTRAGKSPTSDRAATVVKTQHRAGRTVDLTIDSPALGREVMTRVLTPPGYEEEPDRSWPVLYLLHGCCDGTGGWNDWTDATDVEGLTADLGALVVMPEGGPVGYYSDWWNGGNGGAPAWETFHLTELPGLLASDMRASDVRAVAGLSMGGTGALSYAGRHPDFFRAAASFSGRLDTQVDPQGVMNRLPQFGEDPLALWGDPEAQRQVWADHNPLALVGKLPPGFPVYVSSGNGVPGPLDPPDAGHDPLEEQFGHMAEAYVAAAREHGLAVTEGLYGAGTHTWPYWERELGAALPMLREALGA